MGKNDLWIASAAKATGATLMTTDKDFDHLHPTKLTRVWIDERSGKDPRINDCRMFYGVRVVCSA
jgi:hypothetical protein